MRVYGISKQYLSRLAVKYTVLSKVYDPLSKVKNPGVLLHGDRRGERPTWVGLPRKFPLKVGLYSNKAL